MIFGAEICDLRNTLENNLKSENKTFLQVSEQEVCREFQKLNMSKSAGPDNITPRLLKLCARQLAKINTIIFNLSFRTQFLTFGNALV